MDTPSTSSSNAQDLRSGVMVNAVGYLFKPLTPVLLMLVIRQYGAVAFGIFVVCDAVLLLGMRLCLLGLDSGLLRWVAKEPLERQRAQVRPTFVLVGVLTTAFTLLMLNPVVSATIFSAVGSQSPESPVLQSNLRWMLWGLPPLALGELLASALAGKRRLQARVYILSGVMPLSFALVALALATFAWDVPGLAVAFVVSRCVGLFGCGVLYLRGFREVPRTGDWLPDRSLLEFAWPVWLSQLGGSILARLDIMMLTLFGADLAAIGIYAVARKIARVMQELRQAIAPVLTSIASRTSITGNRQELTDGLSYTTVLVLMAQIPVFAALFLLGDWILALHGSGFDSQWPAMMILALGWLIGGLLGHSAAVVMGYGRSRLLVLTVACGIIVQALALWLLVPSWGVNGAACSVMISWLLMYGMHTSQMRAITGGWNYTSSVFRPLVLGTAAAAVAACTAWVTSQFMPAERTARIAACVAFASVFLAGTWRLWRQGVLSGTSEAPAPHSTPSHSHHTKAA